MSGNFAKVQLKSGEHILTVHMLAEGNMNLAWLDFHAAQ
jgi:prepilin-type processing-associated H-X9-DG protein